MTSPQDVTIAIDAGTSLIKAVALDAEGRELALASRATRIETPGGGRSEQDMDEVLRAVVETVRKVVAETGASVGRVALTAQGDGAWIVDADGRATGPAALWNDARAGEIVDEWTRDGTLEAAFRINGSLGNLGLPHAILSWTHRHRPQDLDRAAAVLTCGSWLYLALTGVRGLHPTEASAPWLDVRTGRVSDELVALYGMEWARPLIPDVLEPDRLTAPLGAAIAAECGLPASIPVTLAAYDVVTTGLGSGAGDPGDAFCILGTTLCTGVLMTGVDTSGAPSGLTLLGSPGDPVIRAFPTLAGTGVVDWATRMLALPDPAALTRLAAEAPPGARGARVWPYLSPAGERAPFLDPGARGLVGGLSLEVTRADLARAVIEGLAHVIRDGLDAAGGRPERLTLAGGGAASALWCRTIADVSGVPVIRGDGAQLGARGAQIAALVAAGSFTDPHEALEGMVGERVVYEPDESVAALHEERHADFLATRDALRPRWDAWREERS